jgi:hypothetical protein
VIPIPEHLKAAMDEILVIPIPEHLKAAMDEICRVRLRAAADQAEGPSERADSKRAALELAAFEENRLTPRQVAELAEEAALWLEPTWPNEVGDVERVRELLETTRGLLELRDKALAAVGDDGEHRKPKPAVK